MSESSTTHAAALLATKLMGMGQPLVMSDNIRFVLSPAERDLAIEALRAPAPAALASGELRVLCRLAWNGWTDSEHSRNIIAEHEARDTPSRDAWDRVIAAFDAATRSAPAAGCPLPSGEVGLAETPGYAGADTPIVVSELNIKIKADGDGFLICNGQHHVDEPCEFERFTRSAASTVEPAMDGDKLIQRAIGRQEGHDQCRKEVLAALNSGTPRQSVASPEMDAARHKIAQIINPQVFDEKYSMPTGRRREQRYALERADAILAALARNERGSPNS